jgi:hypothetical protein
MNNIIENNDDHQFATGQVSCDLRVNSDATESETQLDADDAIEQCPDWRQKNFPLQSGSFWV